MSRALAQILDDTTRYIVVVEIAESAHKHGVSDEDIRSALRAEFRTYRQGDRLLVIGADTTGRLLEVVVLDPDDDPSSSTPCHCEPSSTTC